MTLTRQLLTFALTAFSAIAYQDLNTPRTFPVIATKSKWQTRAQHIREQILISAGLWPMPEKTPLKPVISEKIIRDGYTIEKVYFQSLPGFYMGGNLYRPTGQGTGPFPAILNPHGHAAEGRLADTKDFSAAARCINFAKQGMIAFSYDMVGYNDTHFPFPENFQPGPANSSKTHHSYATNAECLLWNINLFGLQTWDSIRALDFLESLPDVDKSRLACTGESGGGTQTYILGAVDDRLAAQAPVVMVSHLMQGGCLCENAPGLRLDYSNVEIDAVPAPRPQLIVGASGDWTKDTLIMEGPSVQSIYKIFDSPDQFHYVRFDFHHNYNQTSREAVYQFFNQTLLHKTDAAEIKEQPYTKEPDSDLLVWPDHNLPADAVTQKQLIQWLIQRQENQLAQLKKNPDQYKKILRTAWKHTLQLDLPERDIKAELSPSEDAAAYSKAEGTIYREGKGGCIPITIFHPHKRILETIVILISPKGKSAYLDPAGLPSGLAKQFLACGFSVMLLEPHPSTDQHKQVELYYTTYNKTLMQEQVQDLITACAFARGSGKASKRVALCGAGSAGLAALLAAPAVDTVVADCDQTDFADDQSLLQPGLFVPGIRALGGYEGILGLAPSNAIRLHNNKTTPQLTDEEIVEWLAQGKAP